MVNIYIAYEINLWPFNIGKEVAWMRKSNNLEAPVFLRSIKLFSLHILSHKHVVTNSVDIYRIGVFIGGFVLTLIESGLPYQLFWQIFFTIWASKICLIISSFFCHHTKWVYNHFHNILRLFDVLPNIPSTASQMIGDYYL